MIFDREIDNLIEGTLQKRGGCIDGLHFNDFENKFNVIITIDGNVEEGRGLTWYEAISDAVGKF
jgi:hypothetical protein